MYISGKLIYIPTFFAVKWGLHIVLLCIEKMLMYDTRHQIWTIAFLLIRGMHCANFHFSCVVLVDIRSKFMDDWWNLPTLLIVYGIHRTIPQTIPPPCSCATQPPCIQFYPPPPPFPWPPTNGKSRSRLSRLPTSSVLSHISCLPHRLSIQ